MHLSGPVRVCGRFAVLEREGRVRPIQVLSEQVKDLGETATKAAEIGTKTAMESVKGLGETATKAAMKNVKDLGETATKTAMESVKDLGETAKAA